MPKNFYTLESLQATLRRYEAQHVPDCPQRKQIYWRMRPEYRPSSYGPDRPCTCGLDDLLGEHDKEVTMVDLHYNEPLLQFFSYLHLPMNLQRVSQPFSYLAGTIVRELPRNPERSEALRKLLEAKDCAVRAALWKD